ncbi:hypothetical protein WMF39_35700 [Sorangium sp. So ce1504]|uniref:monooxygenase n=1 Tax=Sorangium sp. So ce1504 TaxID=3133337 RepID=UPI003F5F09B6
MKQHDERPSRRTTTLLLHARGLAASVPLLALSLGCAAQEAETAQEPTFWQDVAPITASKCTACHQEGGLAPFRLDDYISAKARAGAIDDAVRGGHMPPFLVKHDGSCGDFKDDETLTAEELDVIHRWATGARAEGDRAGAPPTPPVPTLEGGVDYMTPPITPLVDPADPLAAHDEWRCFPVDPSLDADRFITGYQVTPGVRSIVHHVTVYRVTPSEASLAEGKTNQDVMTELDDASPDRPGWECFGGPADELPFQPLFAWAPGQDVVEFPGGTGAPVSAKDAFVVQVHYNIHDHAGASAEDSTRLRLRYEDTVERRAVFVGDDGFMTTLFEPDGPDTLPPGQQDAAYTWRRTRAELALDPGLPPIEVLGVMPHMHERGRTFDLRVASGTQESCIARVNDWDVHWQGVYWYRTPPLLDPSSSLEVTCTFDTRDAEAPVLPGWGTQNEMCNLNLLVALPMTP